MPLKPLFPRKPLMQLNDAPLSTAFITSASKEMESLVNALGERSFTPYVLASLMPAAYLVRNGDVIAKCHEVIRDYEEALEMLPIKDALNIAKAMMAWYEYETEQTLLSPLLRLAKHQILCFDLLVQDNAYLVHSGEVLELIIWLYNITGKEVLLKLIDKLRQSCMDWTSVLHTFPIVKPANRMVNIGKLNDDGDISSLHTRQFYICNGLTVAINLKTPALFAMVSGSSKEMSAPMVGYQKLLQCHGVAGGVFTANPYLNGQNPEGEIDVRVIGELAHSLSVVARVDESAYDSLAIVAENVLKACVKDATVQKVHIVNQAGKYMPVKEAKEHAAAILKGLVAYARVAVSDNGNESAYLHSFTPGKYRMKLNGDNIKVTIMPYQPFDKEIAILVSKPASLKLRMPNWAQDAYAQIGSEPGVLPNENGIISIETKEDESIVTCYLNREVKKELGFGQSKWYRYGNIVLAMEEMLSSEETLTYNQQKYIPYAFSEAHKAQFFGEDE